MSVLKLGLKQIENVVLMKVLEQDESIRNEAFWFESSNGLIFRSVNTPQMTNRQIFVRGFIRGEDEAVVSRTFDNEAAASEYYQKVRQAVQELNNQRRKEAEIPQSSVLTFEIVE